MWMGLPGGKPRHDLPWIAVTEGNVIEISDSYFLTTPVPDITLNLMTACSVAQSGKGQLTLTSTQGAPPTLISFDPNLLTASVETIPLENAELKRNWGSQIFRIQLKTPGKTSGPLKLTIFTM
jgi:hypothetical protein